MIDVFPALRRLLPLRWNGRGADPFGYGAKNWSCGFSREFGIVFGTFCFSILTIAFLSTSACTLISLVILFRNATLTLFLLLPIQIPFIFPAFDCRRGGGMGIG